MLSTNQSGQTFPGLQLKAWAVVSAAGALVKGFNIASVTTNGVGRRVMTFTTAMASTNYLTKIQVMSTLSNIPGAANMQHIVSPTTTVMDYKTFDTAAAPYDALHYIEVWE